MNILDKVGISHLLLVFILLTQFISIELHYHEIILAIGIIGVPTTIISMAYTVKLYNIIKRMGLKTYALYVIGIIVSDAMALIVIFLAIR